MEAKLEVSNKNALSAEEKEKLKFRLQRELLRNPPAVSEMRNLELWNRYQEFDAQGNETNLWWTLQILTDLDRFIRGLNEVQKMVEEMNKGFCPSNQKVLESFAHDFYSAWNSSSTEVINALGLDNVLEILQLLRAHPFFTWPHNGYDYIEEQFPETLKVFRGECKAIANSGVGARISWTLKREVAEYYAWRSPGGVLHEGTVSFDDVLLLQTDEMEVIVKPNSVKISQSIDCHKM